MSLASILLDEDALVLLDACVVINLYAGRKMYEILATLPCSFAVVDLVHAEAQAVRRGGSGDDAYEREDIDLAPFVASGMLLVLSAETDDELSTFIGLTMLQLGDGEALTAALAFQRGHTVATDDRLALRVIANRVPVISSLELIKAWADDVRVPASTIADVLRDVRYRGRYVPHRAHPLRGWWDVNMLP